SQERCFPKASAKLHPKFFPTKFFAKKITPPKPTFSTNHCNSAPYHIKKNLKKNATSVVDPILPAGYRHIPAKFVTLNPRSETRGEDSPLLFI
ncbi:hypothetical protein, partial [Paramuribaculum intestinale]|uniref:hypothetical protein n=1 Tax=Paramuribaculum intestinale TaxID=2094151 RepID=UPI0025A93169